MKLKRQIGRAASLSGIILGLLACLILATTYFSLAERGAGVGALMSLAGAALASVVTTGYLVYAFLRSGE